MTTMPVRHDEEWLHTNIMKFWIKGALKWPNTYETCYDSIPPPTDTGAVCSVYYKVLQSELHALCKYAEPEFRKIINSFERISKLTWSQLVLDDALEWREIQSIPGLNSLRLTSVSRSVCKRNKDRLYFLVVDAPYSAERIASHERWMERMSKTNISHEVAKALSAT